MALRGASETTQDQDWVDFKELAKEGAAAVFTVVRHGEPRDFGNGEITPVIADVIILTGKQAGAYFPGENILAAGIRTKLVNVGDSVVGRIRPYGTRKHPGLEPEEEGDIALAEAALAKRSNGKVPAQNTKNEDSDIEAPF
jgi:hypothetical protein